MTTILPIIIPLEYKQYFVAFLDILGFRALVNGGNEGKRKIDAYFTITNELIAEIKKIQPKEQIGSIVISDSVILSIPIVDEYGPQSISQLRQLCIAIQKIQFRLALENIWLRGAISFGDAYFNAKESQVVGKAYVRAYDLERLIAIHPRVVIDSQLIEKFKFKSSSELINQINQDNGKLHGKDYDFLECNILFDWNDVNLHYGRELSKDVPLFVDYLQYSFESEEKLSTIIENVGQSIYSDNSVYPKFQWITNYLLRLCAFHISIRHRKINADAIESCCYKLMKY